MLEACFVDGAGDAGNYEAVSTVGTGVLDDVLFAHCAGWCGGSDFARTVVPRLQAVELGVLICY